MRSFSELLRVYAERTGVSDAELARAVGVQRQTIFRWKEGAVARPRSAEDVLRLASKLRLTDAERDELLLAAGFPPVLAAPVRLQVLPPVDPIPKEDTAHADRATLSPPALVQPPRRRLILLVAIVLVALGASLIWWLFRPRMEYPVAQPNEKLIVVGQFVNYTGGSQGYNVPGRILQALEREISAARLTDVRVAEWPDPIRASTVADEVAQRSSAALVIWGEYDSGRVLARFTVSDGGGVREAAPLEKLLSSTNDLSAAINSDLPEETRFLALINLAQLLLERGQPEDAAVLLVQADTHPSEDVAGLATLRFLTGLAAQQSQTPDLDAAISAYSEALALQPDLVAAHNNRAIAYLKRQAEGDAALALEDLTRYLADHPLAAEALTNRGTAHLQLGGTDHARLALIDLDRALDLAPEIVEALLNRGLARLRLDEAGWDADFEQVLSLRAGHPAALESLCWAYAVQGQSDTALSWCDQALAAADSAPARHGRAIAYALSGQYAAAAQDLEAYLATLGPPSLAKEERRVREWIVALRLGSNPFTTHDLDLLRQE